MEGATIPRTIGLKPTHDRGNVAPSTKLKGMGILSVMMLLVLISPVFLQAEVLPVVTESHKNGSPHLSAEDLVLNLTYWSQTNSTVRFAKSGSLIAGDHIILRASWSPKIIVESVQIRVIAPAIPASISNYTANATYADIDTRLLGNNATCIVNSTVWLLNGTIYSEVVEDLYIGNFFLPHVTVITPNGGEEWSGSNNITWNAWDKNLNETLSYDVLVSSNSGKTFEPLASNLNQTWYMWDCSTTPLLPTYLIEVRVTDGIYVTWDRSDANFTAGSGTIPTSSTNTTTTSEPPPVDPRLLAFLVLFIVTSGIMALVVYYVAKKWF
ncbi:MAG: hypothetical protein ACFFD6_05740 [Candidatus Thorarchaeota archaeon]